jgi:Mrp family chromosome partitioning ATPase
MSAKAQMARIPAIPLEPATESIFNLQQAVFEGAEETGESAARLTPSGTAPETHGAASEVLVPVVELGRESLRHIEIMRRDCPEAALNSFRQLRGRLLRRSAELTGLASNPRTVFVTSPGPGQGKSFVARNLAVMIGVIPECRVLLAEANPARPSLTRSMGLLAEPGVRDSHRGGRWQEMVRRVPGLEVFVAGAGSPEPDAIDPFDSRPLERLRSRIASEFDWLVLDGGSLQESSDAETLSHFADLTVVVVQPGSMGCRELAKCLSRLNPGKLAGFVFNRPL